MNTIQRILLLTGACLSLNAQAQSFGDFLKQSAANAARAAVSGNVDRAVAVASKIRCQGCEGGYYFDAWGGHSLLRKGADYPVEFPRLLAGLKRGESVSWKGTQYHVSITSIGDHPIGDTPCRQLHYVLKDGSKTVSEYDGMVCEYTRPYISKPTWNEVV